MRTSITTLLLLSCLSGCSRSPDREDFLKDLSDPKKASETLDMVLDNPDTYPADILYIASSIALQDERLEDSGFLFYAAQLRGRFDEKCFPPLGKGGDSPLTLYGAFSFQLGSVINPAIMAEPKTFSTVVERLEGFHPQAEDAYTPGYEFTQRLSQQEADAAIDQHRSEFIDGMRSLSTLLDDPGYFAAFRIVQEFNLTFGDKRPSTEEYEEAITTLKRVKQERGIEGPASLGAGSAPR